MVLTSLASVLGERIWSVILQPIPQNRIYVAFIASPNTIIIEHVIIAAVPENVEADVVEFVVATVFE